jgi:integrase
MALVTQRIWRSGPRKVRRAAWGYTVQVDSRQARCFREDWTKDDAEKALAARLLGVDTAPGGVPSPAPAGLTFGEMVEKFLDAKRGEKKRSIGHDEQRRKPLLAFFGPATPLKDITTRRVAEYRTARLGTPSKHKTPLAPATVNRELALLRSILRMALAWDELDKLPTFKLSKEVAKKRFLTPDEITRLLEACAPSKNQRLRDIVTVALHTGLRKGELLALRWEQIDMARGQIALGNDTKSGHGRDVPMNSAVYAALAPLRADAGGLDATGRVWGTLKKMDAAYGAALRRAKILDAEVNFHTLRHTFASHFVMRGGSLVKLQVILGHASVRTTQIYARLSPDHLAGATSILDGLGTQINAPSTHDAATLAPGVSTLA